MSKKRETSRFEHPENERLDLRRGRRGRASPFAEGMQARELPEQAPESGHEQRLIHGLRYLLLFKERPRDTDQRVPSGGGGYPRPVAAQLLVHEQHRLG